MQADIDELSYNLKKLEERVNIERKEKESIISEKQKIKEKLESIIEQQKRNEESLKELEKRREEQKKRMIEDEFKRDFENYLKLKSANTSKDVLIQYLRRIILQYQTEGIDISPATIELQRLVKE
jgi:small-conductance mechanosensitive channel